MTLFSSNNSKLGAVYSFSLPLSTCHPKHSKGCSKYCYAKHLFRLYPNYRIKMDKNLAASRQAGFVEACKKELKNGTKFVRLHVSGDFYSQEYLDKWVQIAEACPTHTFYTYTRNLDLDYSKRPGNLLIYLSDVDRNLQAEYPRFDGVTTISFDKKVPKGFQLCQHQVDGSQCAQCGKCMQRGGKICFKKH